MATTWILIARAETNPASEPVVPPRSAVLACPVCARAVRAYARSLREPEARTVYACPNCGALVEEVDWTPDDTPALPGATLDELKEAVQQATQEAERWRCQADGARQRKDLAWAERAVAWSVAAEQRAVALRRQAATTARDDEPSTRSKGGFNPDP
jgi:predicted RNA-binding Zn-ribbon protein involved in translation (DUF1610 family)